MATVIAWVLVAIIAVVTGVYGLACAFANGMSSAPGKRLSQTPTIIGLLIVAVLACALYGAN